MSGLSTKFTRISRENDYTFLRRLKLAEVLIAFSLVLGLTFHSTSILSKRTTGDSDLPDNLPVERFNFRFECPSTEDGSRRLLLSVDRGAVKGQPIEFFPVGGTKGPDEPEGDGEDREVEDLGDLKLSDENQIVPQDGQGAVKPALGALKLNDQSYAVLFCLGRVALQFKASDGKETEIPLLSPLSMKGALGWGRVSDSSIPTTFHKILASIPTEFVRTRKWGRAPINQAAFSGNVEVSISPAGEYSEICRWLRIPEKGDTLLDDSETKTTGDNPGIVVTRSNSSITDEPAKPSSPEPPARSGLQRSRGRLRLITGLVGIVVLGGIIARYLVARASLVHPRRTCTTLFETIDPRDPGTLPKVLATTDSAQLRACSKELLEKPELLEPAPLVTAVAGLVTSNATSSDFQIAVRAVLAVTHRLHSDARSIAAACASSSNTCESSEAVPLRKETLAVLQETDRWFAELPRPRVPTPWKFDRYAASTSRLQLPQQLLSWDWLEGCTAPGFPGHASAAIAKRWIGLYLGGEDAALFPLLPRCKRSESEFHACNSQLSKGPLMPCSFSTECIEVAEDDGRDSWHTGMCVGSPDKDTPVREFPWLPAGACAGVTLAHRPVVQPGVPLPATIMMQGCSTPENRILALFHALGAGVYRGLGLFWISHIEEGSGTGVLFPNQFYAIDQVSFAVTTQNPQASPEATLVNDLNDGTYRLSFPGKTKNIGLGDYLRIWRRSGETAVTVGLAKIVDRKGNDFVGISVGCAQLLRTGDLAVRENNGSPMASIEQIQFKKCEAMYRKKPQYERFYKGRAQEYYLDLYGNR